MKPWDDTTVLAKKGVSLTVLQHWPPGKERLLTILDSGRVKKPPTQNSQTVSGLPLLVVNLAALTPCQVSTAAFLMPGNRVGIGVRNCLGSHLHQTGEHHASLTREHGATVAPSHKCTHPCTVSSYVGKQLKPACMTGSWIIFLEICSFSPTYTIWLVFLPLLPLFGGAGYLHTRKGMGCKVARRCPWKGREIRGWSCAYWKRRHRKERGRTGGTQKHKDKNSPRVTEPLPHLSDSSAML